MIHTTLLCALFLGAATGGAPAQARSAQRQCTSDYLYSAARDYHRLSAAKIAVLEHYVETGEAQKGWATLASYGDNYAVFASKITDNSTSNSTFMENMLAVHWQVTNNREIFKQYSAPYANQHFRQYVEILKSGVWPDSDQILNSYLAAARKFNLPEDTVLVAMWSSSCLGGLFAWQKALKLPPERVVPQSNACMNISESRAALIMFKDSTGIFLRTIGSLFE